MCWEKEGSSIRTLDLYIADMTAEEREIVKGRLSDQL